MDRSQKHSDHRMEKLLTVLFLFYILSVTGATKKQNVLVFVADDMGFEIGAYNNSVSKTPNLDTLAKNGLLFKRASTSVSSCSPSRSVIMTGLPQHQNGMYGLHHGPHHFNSLPSVHSMSGILNKHGIRTGIIGKKHVGPEEVYPFDFAYTEENNNLLQVGRNVTRMKDLARQFFQGTKGQFLLYIGFFDPHRCAQDSKYGIFCESFGNGQPGMGVIPDWTPPNYRPQDVEVPFFVPDNMVSRLDLVKQYTSINRMDRGVGLILEELAAAGHADDTLVLFTSDNGIPYPAAKTNLYTPGMGEPMIVSSPVHRERWGQESDALVSLLDIVPTVLDWLSIPYPEYKIIKSAGITKLTGNSLLPLLQKEPQSGWDVVFASHDFHEVTMNYPMRVIETKQYKLIHNLNYKMPYPIAADLAEAPPFLYILKNASEHKPVNWYRNLHQYYYRAVWELYDLQKDPKELNNLADNTQYTSVLEQLKGSLYAWLLETSDIWVCLPGGTTMKGTGKGPHCRDMENGTPIE